LISSLGDSNLGGTAFGAQLEWQVRQKYNVDFIVNIREVIQVIQNNHNTDHTPPKTSQNSKMADRSNISSDLIWEIARKKLPWANPRDISVFTDPTHRKPKCLPRQTQIRRPCLLLLP
jgi:hypothetical protein